MIELSSSPKSVQCLNVRLLDGLVNRVSQPNEYAIDGNYASMSVHHRTRKREDLTRKLDLGDPVLRKTQNGFLSDPPPYKQTATDNGGCKENEKMTPLCFSGLASVFASLAGRIRVGY